MQITFIRHTSVALAPGICYGHADIDVSATFYTEAQQVKLQLQNHTFDAVFSSPSIRCRKLAGFCGFENPVIDRRLMELNFGDWELKAWNEITDPQLDLWYNNWFYEKTTAGESFEQMVQRVNDFLIEIKQLSCSNILVFTHAGVLRSVDIICNKTALSEVFNKQFRYGSQLKVHVF